MCVIACSFFFFKWLYPDLHDHTKPVGHTEAYWIYISEITGMCMVISCNDSRNKYKLSSFSVILECIFYWVSSFGIDFTTFLCSRLSQHPFLSYPDNSAFQSLKYFWLRFEFKEFLLYTQILNKLQSTRV